jgi:hypothetical protein
MNTDAMSASNAARARPGRGTRRSEVRSWHAPLAAVATTLLAGCASFSSLTSQVTSHGDWPAGRVAGSYAFERLPSQQADPEPQQRLEDAARGALAAAGFVAAADPAGADVRVQLGARVSALARSPFDDPFWVGGVGRPFWSGGPFGRHRHPGWGPGLGAGWYGSPFPRYEHEVGVLIRDRRSGTPLYQAHASNDGLSAELDSVLPAMFSAALKDFPQAVPNPRSVTVPIAR